MKLYVVEYSEGSYEDHSTHIEGIFTDPAKAEEYANKIRSYIDMIKDEDNPIGHENTNIMSDEEIDIYFKWCERKNTARQFNYASVDEYESDTELNVYKQ